VLESHRGTSYKAEGRIHESENLRKKRRTSVVAIGGEETVCVVRTDEGTVGDRSTQNTGRKEAKSVGQAREAWRTERMEKRS